MNKVYNVTSPAGTTITVVADSVADAIASARLLGGDQFTAASTAVRGRGPEPEATGEERPRPKTIVVLGSSNSAGQSVNGYFFPGPGFVVPDRQYKSFPGSWAAHLENALQAVDPEWTVINRGYAGTSSQTAIDRFWTDVAPHRPSHVVLCQGAVNDSYSGPLWLARLQQLIRLCRQIGAQPVVRGMYPYTGITLARYAEWLDLNQQLNNLGVPVIDHMSGFDNPSTGEFVDPIKSEMPDNLHVKEIGHLWQFRAIDLNIFLNEWSPPRPRAAGTSWLMPTGVTSSYGITLKASDTAGLPPGGLYSFTMRSRIKTQAGLANAKAFMHITSAALPAEDLRLRNAVGPYDLYAATGVSITSAVNPTSDFNTHDCVIAYNQITNVVALYIDGVLIGSATPPTAYGPLTEFAWGGRSDSAGNTPSGASFADMALWNVPLSAAEVANLYQGARPNQAGLIFEADLSRAPRPGGLCPNLVGNGVIARVGGGWTRGAVI